MLLWTAASPRSGQDFLENHGDLLMRHLSQGLGGGVSSVTSFSKGLVLQWLRELSELRLTDQHGATKEIPSELELTIWMACTGRGEPSMWKVLTHRKALQQLEPWLRDELGLYLRDANTVFLDGPGSDRVMSLKDVNKPRGGPLRNDQNGMWLANFDLRAGWRQNPLRPVNLDSMFASKHALCNRAEVAALIKLKREAAVVLERLGGALMGMDLEHALALSCYPGAEDTLEALCAVREGGVAVLASAKLKAGLAKHLAALVPPLDGQPAAMREAELRAFRDDYLALLRWRHLQTQRDGTGRLPAQAVASQPVPISAMTSAKGKLLSLPASPVALKHALERVDAERAAALERETRPPAWWSRAMVGSTAAALLVFCLLEWMIITMGTCVLPPARADPWTYLGDPWNFACGKKQYFFACAFNLLTIAWWYYTAVTLHLRERASSWSLTVYTVSARVRGWPLPVTLQIDAVTRRTRRQVVDWSRRLLGAEMAKAAETAAPVAARRAVALVQEVLGLHGEEAELLGKADCTPSAAPLPCSLAVAKAYLALPVEGSDGAAASGGGESGGAFALQLERIFCHAAATARPHRPERASPQRLLGMQARDRLHAFGRATESDDDSEEDEDDADGPTRFGVGARVEVLMRDAESVEWRSGVVASLWVKRMCPYCPTLHSYPYRVLLDGRHGGPAEEALVEHDDHWYVRSASAPLLALPAPPQAGGAMTVEALLRANGWRTVRSGTRVTVQDGLGKAVRRERAEARAKEAAEARERARQAEAERRRRRQQEEQAARQREAAEELVAPLLRRAEGLLHGPASLGGMSDEELLPMLLVEGRARCAEREALLAELRKRPAQQVGEATAARVRAAVTTLEAEIARIGRVREADQRRRAEKAQQEEVERRKAEDAARRAAAEKERERKRAAEEERRRQQEEAKERQRAKEEARRREAETALASAEETAEAGGAPALRALERAIADAEAAGVAVAILVDGGSG